MLTSPRGGSALCLVIAVALLTATCTTNSRTTYVSGQSLKKGAPTLRMRGHAKVTRTISTKRNPNEFVEDPDHPVSLRVEEMLTDGDQERRIVDIITGCGVLRPPLVPVVCTLDGRETDLFSRTKTTHTWSWGAATTLTVLPIAIGMGVCAEICEEGSLRSTSRYSLATLGIAAGALLVWAIVSCIGHWGQPGCRD